MPKITFMGAGSSVFVRNIIGDCMCREALKDSEVALYDIDAERLDESKKILGVMNKTVNSNRMKIKTYCGVQNRKKALAKADFVVNAVQVGGYKPSTVIDFEIPKKYGLRQTIADSLGIGGIFRALRTAPVMLDFAHEMEKVCPDALFLNYTNPMAMLTGIMLKGSGIKTVGLCHSVQYCALSLYLALGKYNWGREGEPYPEYYDKDIRFKVAGINHMAWLLELKEDGRDVYPEFRELGRKLVADMRAGKAEKKDMIRLEIMNKFGFFITESSEHNAEYTPYWIKSGYPELIEEFNIPLDEYLSRCVRNIKNWKDEYARILKDATLTHEATREYGAGIMNAVTANIPFQFGGNILNDAGYISNLPREAVVEVPCFADGNGVQGTCVGNLPVQCAALNMTNINPQLLAMEAALTLKKERIYQAAMLDPHTSAELPIDKIIALCDDLIEAHGDMLPEYK